MPGGSSGRSNVVRVRAKYSSSWCRALASSALADAIYDAYQKLFAALPLAVRTSNRVFLCHTVPDPLDPGPGNEPA